MHAWAQQTLLLTADIYTWAHQTGYCSVLTYIHVYSRHVLLTAGMCTWAQQMKGYCRLLTYVHEYSRHATVDC